MENSVHGQLGEKPSDALEGFLTARTGTFQRTTRTTSQNTFRVVDISECPLTHWTTWEHDGVRNNLKESPGATINVSVRGAQPGIGRWKEDPEKIGAFVVEQMLIYLYLPPATFDHFWKAAEARDAALRQIDIVLKVDPKNSNASKILSVTNAGLIESLPTMPVHPVVSELRTIRDRVIGIAVIGIAVYFAVKALADFWQNGVP